MARRHHKPGAALWVEHHRVRVDVLFFTAVLCILAYFLVAHAASSPTIPSYILNLQRRLNKIPMKDPVPTPCPQGTTDLGITTTAYVDGENFRTRLCRVHGFKVSTMVAENYKLLIEASRKAKKDIVLGKNGSGYREMRDQISTYVRHCNTSNTVGSIPPFPKKVGETVKCVGASAPGYSNHQAGLAIDAECKGESKVIGSGSRCYRWLKANAPWFGLTDQCTGWKGKAGCEPWHISPNGD